MADSSTIAVVLAFIIATSGFAGACLTAPSGYSPDSITAEGLVREIVFDGDRFRALESIPVMFVYRNPSNVPVSVNVTASTILIEYVDGKVRGEPHPLVWNDAKSVTIPAGGEYVVAEDVYVLGRGCFFELEWEGLRRGVGVANGEVLARLVPDSEEYKVSAGGGTATFLYYNPTQHNVTFRVPASFYFVAKYEDGNWATGLSDSFWWAVWDRTLPPGGSFVINKYYFPTAKEGEMTLTINDLTETVTVVPRR